MNPVTVEHTIDVTSITPRERHPAILKAWSELESGGALILINDHDPLPLYYQFACEYQGGFQWAYLQQGPDVWRVRIAKGDFPNSGFVPDRQEMAKIVKTSSASDPRVFDTRPLFERGETPCHAIDEAVATLAPGQSLVLLVPFEPVPLYAKLGKEGFLHQSKQLTDGSWRVEFRR